MSPTPDKDGTGPPVRMRVEDLRIVMTGSGAEVVDDISLQLTAGRTLGLVGESGSGKTTVGLALLGYARRGLDIERGRVVLDGADILAMPDDARRQLRGGHVAYVPQDPGTALNPALTVGYQLAEVTRQQGEEGTAEHLDSLLERLRLPKERIRRSYPHQLSGGQQQRVALAMAFARRPRVIVLDEPTTGLDVTVQRQVLEAIRELCATSDVSGVFVSHDLAVVSELVDEVAVMYAGRIVETGNCLSMFAAPAHPYTRGLLRAAPSADHAHTLHGLDGRPPRPGRRPSGCFFAPRCELQIPECNAAQPPLLPAGQPGDETHLARCIRVDVSRSLGRGKASDALVAHSGDNVDAVLLSVSELRATYGPTEVLHGVSLVVRPGECVAVVGESGSGKTTLARCIVGLHKRSGGAVSLQGKPLATGARKRDAESLRALQYIFQNPFASLNPRKTIREILELPLRRFYDLPRDDREGRIMRALEDVALHGEMLRAYPHELSGGERQRVAIARALVVEPRVLVCDEITSALDVSVQAAIIETLRRLQAERSLSLLFITHNLALVRSIAAQVLVVKDGEVVEAGAVSDVLDRPQAEYTKRLLDDLPHLRTAAADSGISGRSEQK